MNSKGLLISMFIIIILSLGSYFVIKLDFTKVEEYVPATEIYDVDLEYEIESIEEVEDSIVIKGWVVETNGQNSYINRKILLRDTNGEISVVKTESQCREDLKEKNLENLDYTNSGLIARIDKSKLDNNFNYEVGILVKNQEGKERVEFTGEMINIK